MDIKTDAPLQSIEARYKDLLQHLGVTSHDGAVAEINSLQFLVQNHQIEPSISQSEFANKFANNSKLIDKAQGVARNLSYNDEGAVVKHLLSELTHRLGNKCVIVKKCNGRLCAMSLFGRTRRMTFKERFLYRVFGVIPDLH